MRQVLPKSSITYVDADGNVEDYVPEEEEPAAPPVQEKDFLAELRKNGIDTDGGLKYCVGDKDFYKSLLIQFATESADKIASMKNYYSMRDWHNYEILVHALKLRSIS